MVEEKENVEIYTVQEESLPEINLWKLISKEGYVCKVGTLVIRKFGKSSEFSQYYAVNSIIFHNILNSIWVCFNLFCVKSPGGASTRETINKAIESLFVQDTLWFEFVQ